MHELHFRLSDKCDAANPVRNEADKNRKGIIWEHRFSQDIHELLGCQADQYFNAMTLVASFIVISKSLAESNTTKHIYGQMPWLTSLVISIIRMTYWLTYILSTDDHIPLTTKRCLHPMSETFAEDAAECI